MFPLSYFAKIRSPIGMHTFFTIGDARLICSNINIAYELLRLPKYIKELEGLKSSVVEKLNLTNQVSIILIRIF